MRLSDIAEIVLVFVPMFGDSFFTIMKKNARFEGYMVFSSSCLGILFSRYTAVHLPGAWVVFVPMFGDSFFTIPAMLSNGEYVLFSSPCLGILFSPGRCLYSSISAPLGFRPHVWGFFFHIKVGESDGAVMFTVFVPMFGDSFFTNSSTP